MTVNDPRPELAAKPAAGPAPAAEALAAACAEDANTEPPSPILSDCDGSRDACHRGDRKHVGRLNTPEYRAWKERRRRRDERDEREEEEAGALAARARGGGDGDREEHDIP